MNDYAIATTAARAVIDSEITNYVPAMFQDRIPDDAKQSFAEAVAKAVVDALAAANVTPPS